ncbi:hypothetical protein L596_013878 [Steinernema carpocapsae]|uniref:Uncharacterized protein n=1 Tax=Steinernema carpocapsae TaxID=34508 RepID=A0A4U5P1J1_STECR|nr:hypothetical protein L596_013878 [Steinernema carpocapsae]
MLAEAETTDRRITFIGETSITTILALIFTYRSARFPTWAINPWSWNVWSQLIGYLGDRSVTKAAYYLGHQNSTNWF